MAPIRFDHYVERCLYGPGGFYTTTGEAGRRGDFITSPEVGPLFGAVVAKAITAWWIEAGRPEPFTVIDAGCGPGTLLRSVAKAGRDLPWTFVGVDRAASAERTATLAAAGITLLSEMPDDLDQAVVVANELLDNLPFRILVAGDGNEQWHEVFVESDWGDGSGSSAQEVLVPIEGGDETVRQIQQLSWSGQEPLKGSRIPLFAAASSWVTGVIAKRPIRLCVFDYGAPTTQELVGRGRWLRTYRQHHRGHDPYDEPGRFDITTDVGFDQLPPASWVGRQHEFMQEWGIEAMVDEGRRYWHEHAATPDVQALMMRSRDTEAPALLDQRGLGSWMTAVWRSQ